MTESRSLRVAGEQQRSVATRGTRGEAYGVKAAQTSAIIAPQTSVYGQVTGLFSQYAPLGFFLPWEILDHIELLAQYNPDYSQAVDNICTLANSGHELFVDASTELQVKRTKEHLEDLARTVQDSHGGVDGLIDKLLRQGATYGAMCGEWVLDDDLTQVVDFADINPKKIRFFWDEDLYRYVPFQKVTAAQAEEARKRGQEVRGGCVRLNENTFHYFAFNAEPNSPYGTPPFVAALLNIGIQRDMIANMAQIVKKVGLLGLIDITVERLPPIPGETDEQFSSRANAFLSSYVDAAEDMVREGGMVHFDDVVVQTASLSGNAAGATNIFKQNEELIFSGLKSMPSVQGRSYSTTETYAGVAYDIIIRNTKKYQRAIKRMIEAGYWLSVNLQSGQLKPTDLSLQFKENKTLHRLQDAQSEALEIKNAGMLWLAGVINQLQFANRLGHSSVDTKLEEPPPELYGGAADVNPDNNGDNEGDGNDALDDTGGGKPDNSNNNSASLGPGYIDESEEEAAGNIFV